MREHDDKATNRMELRNGQRTWGMIRFSDHKQHSLTILPKSLGLELRKAKPAAQMHTL